VHVDRESHLEQALVLVPVHIGLDHELPAAGGQAQDLGRPGAPEHVLEADGHLLGPLDRTVVVSGAPRSWWTWR